MAYILAMDENMCSSKEIIDSMARTLFNMSIRIYALRDIRDSNKIEENTDKISELIRCLVKDYTSISMEHKLLHDICYIG